MKRNILLYLTLVGVIFTFFSCEKDETQAVLKNNASAPTLTAPANITLERSNATNILKFEGSLASYGFDALVQYELEADVKGNEFANAKSLGTSFDNVIEISVADLNSLLLDLVKPDIASVLEFRVVASIEGEVDDLYSEVAEVSVIPYGLPRLDVNITGATEAQKIYSAAGDGNYVGFVKFEAGATFTITDPDAGKTYGGDGTSISEGGAAITVTQAGWYRLTVSTGGLTMENYKYLVGIVGVVNGWSAPDLEMDYDVEGKFWYRNDVVLPDGGMKFRHNEDWGNDFNLGVLDNSAPDLDNLVNAGSSQDILMTAGTYDIKLWLVLDGENGGRCTIVPSE